MPEDEVVPGDTSFLNERIYFFKRWTWMKIVCAFLVLVASYGFYVQDQSQGDLRENQAADAQRQIDTDYRQCQEFNKVTGIVLTLVETSATQSFNPEVIPSFKDLDPATQKFFKDLLSLSQSQDPNDPNSFINIARKLLEARDCEALYPTRTK